MANLAVGINFIHPEAEELYRKNCGFQDSISSGFDLINVEDVKLSRKGEFKLINLGVTIRPPENFHSILIPRSSTFKKYRILQANSIGLIDENYCGKDDVWLFPVMYLPEQEDSVVIPKGTRICQFFIQPKFRFVVYSYVSKNNSRGGFGSTGS